MRRSPQSHAVGQKWRIGIAVAIIALGGLFLTLAIAPPTGSTGWVWGFALLIYIPIVLFGAAMLKYVVLIVRHAWRSLQPPPAKP
jgi:hypothetical protein